MEPLRFFYSTNGNDVAGPVTEDELRQLWKDHRLGAGSFVRGAGESAWTPLGPGMPTVEKPAPVRSMRIVPSEVFAMAKKATGGPVPKGTARLPLPPIIPPTTAAPPATAAPLPVKAPAPAPAEIVDEAPRDGRTLALVLNASAAIATLGASVVAALALGASEGDDTYAWAYFAGFFVAAVLAITVVPWLLSFFAKGIARVAIRSGGMVVLALVVTVVVWSAPRCRGVDAWRSIPKSMRRGRERRPRTLSSRDATFEQEVEKPKVVLTASERAQGRS